MIRGYEDVRGGAELVADVVVVGSGPGGAAVSRALVERGRRIVVLEEGPPTPRFRPNQTQTSRYHMQENGSMIATGSGLMPIAAGRGVGGGSLVNSAICFRTPDHVLHEWETLLGDDRFSAANLAPVFDMLEARLEIAETPEGVAGANNKLIVRGIRALGLEGGYVRRNTPGCVGCGICNFGCPSGGKASVDRNLIPDAIAAGAIVQGDVKVDRILVEGGRAVGVSGIARHTDTQEEVGRVTVRADRVVIAAGAIGTPRLLHHAGVAPLLGPAVGVGLHCHPGNVVVGICDEDIHLWRGATQGAYFVDPSLPGVLPHTMSAFPAAFMIILATVGYNGKEATNLLKKLCGCLVMISDNGHGTVGATASGMADIRYWFDPGDYDRIKAGMVVTAKVLFAGGARRILAGVLGVGIHDSVETFEAALAKAGPADFALYSSHPMATCRMGTDPNTSVIGPSGEAHGLPGLFLADSSIFPTALGVNPQLTTMALATVIGRSL